MSSPDDIRDTAIDGWAHAQHAALGADLAERLDDVEAGLREILLATHHTALLHDIAGDLDVKAGLTAIVQTAGPATPAAHPQTTSSPPPVDTDRAAAAVEPVTALPPLLRLKLRMHPIADCCAVARARAFCGTLISPDAFDGPLIPGLTRALDRVCELTRGLTRALDRICALARDLHSDLDGARVPDLARDLDLARALALAHARDLARDLDSALAHARDLDSALAHARDLDGDRDRDLARDLARARVHARDLDSAVNLTLALTVALNLTFNRTLTLALNCDPLDRGSIGVAVAQVLSALSSTGDRVRILLRVDEVLDDLVGADLRGADLSGLRLVGIRWSRETQWPPGWLDQIERDSEPVPDTDGVFVIRAGDHLQARV